MSALATETQLTLATVKKSSCVLVGDCRELMRGMADNSVDAIVTDPPYELGFMGKRWDASGIAYDLEVWRQALRVLKPGGHLLAFGGTRTYHRMACAIEGAGFEVRDSIHWIYGSGFPKSLNVEKAGAGEAWQGWGTALKPAHEPIVVARKPLDGTVAANVLKHGTGAINVDGCRVGNGNDKGTWPITVRRHADVAYSLSPILTNHSIGRWPPNVLFSHSPDCDDECAEWCAVAAMDGQSGFSRSPRIGSVAVKKGRVNQVAKGNEKARISPNGHGDSGGASRFFPCFHYGAKAGRKEREAGCEHLPARSGAQAVEREEGSDGVNSPRAGAGRTASEVRNRHPTVKPVEVMRWLVRLVTPPNGIVLDPFAGSGTTGVACVREGFDFIGCELSHEYASIARARIKHG